MRTLLLIFTCKRPKYADTGRRGVKKRSNFSDVLYGWPLTFIQLVSSRQPGLSLARVTVRFGVSVDY